MSKPSSTALHGRKIGEKLRVKQTVPTWGGREGEIVRLISTGPMASVQLRIGAGTLWFDPWEVEALS